MDKMKGCSLVNRLENISFCNSCVNVLSPDYVVVISGVLELKWYDFERTSTKLGRALFRDPPHFHVDNRKLVCCNGKRS